MSRSETKKRLKSKLLDTHKVTIEEITAKQNLKRLEGVRDNIRTKIDKAVNRKRFDKLEYKYFYKHHFVQYLYIMADGGNSFDKIDQETVDSLDMMLRENNSYDEFSASHSQDWVETDGVMLAFKYLFENRR
jgi:hypothetical protein